MVDCCNNVTNGGTISEDQAICDVQIDPDSLFNITAPSGGTGALMYQWYFSTTGSPYTMSNPDWTLIPGAEDSGYNQC
ncbi:MAG: hypothetical protein R2784_11190 [Saprospiraceae bacterium]